jgi:anaerobic magnesium-protoporphyrin IX monomethyl ester cyclase
MKELTYLINPSERGILTNAGDRMPLGLLYIARTLETRGHEVRVYDLNHTPESKLMKDITTEKPVMIGVSCLTSPMVNEAKRILGRIKTYNNRGRVIVGGYHPTIMPEDFEGLVDNVVTGEGEYAVECLRNDILDRPIVRNGLTTLEGLIPSRHLLNAKDYNLVQEGLRTGTIITSRGCPNACVFCGNLNRKVRKHSVFDVSRDLDSLVQGGYQAVYFLDDVFTLDKDRAITIGYLCKERDLKFRLTTRANYMDERLVRVLAHSGLDIASMGVESGNPEILSKVGKNQTKEQIVDAVKLCKDYGVKTKGFFIIGLPGETEQTATQTLEFARQLRQEGMIYQDVYPLVPFPGTDIWNNPQKYGIRIIDKDYTNYLQATKGEPKIVCETVGLKAERISELLREAKQ